jgi:hypothetical protein
MLDREAQRRQVARVLPLGIFCLFLAQVSYVHAIIYDWTPDSGSSSGFIQFDETAITDPENFTIDSIAQVLGGQFDFNESPFVDAFDILDPFGDGFPPSFPSGNFFSAVDGELVEGLLQKTNTLFLVDFAIDPVAREVSCFNRSGFEVCGAPAPAAGDAVSARVDGSWVYRQPQPAPEPTTTMCLTAGLIVLTATIRRRRQNV